MNSSSSSDHLWELSFLRTTPVWSTWSTLTSTALPSPPKSLHWIKPPSTPCLVRTVSSQSARISFSSTAARRFLTSKPTKPNFTLWVNWTPASKAKPPNTLPKKSKQSFPSSPLTLSASVLSSPPQLMALPTPLNKPTKNQWTKLKLHLSSSSLTEKSVNVTPAVYFVKVEESVRSAEPVLLLIRKPESVSSVMVVLPAVPTILLSVTNVSPLKYSTRTNSLALPSPAMLITVLNAISTANVQLVKMATL